MFISLFPDDKQSKQNKWYASIVQYSDIFKEDVEQWLSENDESIHYENPLQSDPTPINKELLTIQ